MKKTHFFVPFFFGRFTAEARGFTLGHLDDPGGLGTFGLLPGVLRPGGVQADHRSVRADAAEHEQGGRLVDGFFMHFLCRILEKTKCEVDMP